MSLNVFSDNVPSLLQAMHFWLLATFSALNGERCGMPKDSGTKAAIPAEANVV